MRIFPVFLFFLLAVPAICLATPGTDFWLGVPDIGADAGTVQVLITTQTDNTTGTVQISSLAFSQNFNVSSGQTTVVALPAGVVDSTADSVHNLTVHITATDEITVACGFLDPSISVPMIEATPVLPLEALGTEYWTLGYSPDAGLAGSSTHLLIVSPQDNTSVTITPSVAASGHPAGTPYIVNMNSGDLYQLRPTDDLSGSHIVSDKPVAVFSSGNLIRIPVGTAFASGLWEQLPPVSAWGTEYLIAGLAGRQNGDRYRFLASSANTTVNYNGSSATIGQGSYLEVVLTGPVYVTATQPVLVAQFAHSQTYDNLTGGAFLSFPPPSSHLGQRYAVAFGANVTSTNYINIVAPDSAVGQIQMDGTAIPSGSFTAIGTTGYSYAQVAGASTEHSLTGPAHFAVTAYGFTDFQGYAYSTQPFSGLPCVFGDDFQSGAIDPGKWTIVKPSWSESAGNLVGTPAGRLASIVATGFPGCAGACTINTTMRSAGGAFNKVWLLAWYTDKKNGVQLLMDEQKNKWLLKQKVNGVLVAKGKALMTIDPSTPYAVSLSFDGTHFQLSVNGNSVLTLAPGAPPQGTAGFQVKNTTGTFGAVCIN